MIAKKIRDIVSALRVAEEISGDDYKSLTQDEKPAKKKKVREKYTLTLTSGSNSWDFIFDDFHDFDKHVYPWSDDYYMDGHKFRIDDDHYKMPLKNYLAKWRSQPLVERVKDLKDTDPKAFEAMKPALETDVPGKHKRFLMDMVEKDHSPAEDTSGEYQPFTLRSSHENFRVFLPKDFSNIWGRDGSVSLSEMNKWKPDGRKLTDALLSVKDPKILKQNQEGLWGMIRGSYGKGIGEYIRDKLD